MTDHPDFQKLKERLGEVADLDGALILLGWDELTMMPPNGASTRARTMATLGKIWHDMLTSDETGEWLDHLGDYERCLPFESNDASLIRVARRSYAKVKAIPSELEVERSLAASAGYQAWVEARANADYSMLQPALERIVDVVRKEIALHRDARPDVEDDYDIVLDDYEPGLKTAEVTRVFDILKNAIPPLIERIRNKPPMDESPMHGMFPIDLQRAFVTTVATQLGVSWDSWRLDPTEHPFVSALGARDIRITTRYREDFLSPALFSAMHEFGHGLYDYGMPPEFAHTPLRRSASAAWDESQSLLWENLVGRGKPFSRYVLAELKQAFPAHFAMADESTFYRAVNSMRPSCIRVEADELTYNLHIIARFEIERDIFSGTVTLSDLPQAWNARMKEYLGIDVPDDAQGVLQDPHWPSGGFGYFPTYTLGHILAHQLWERISTDLPALDDDIAAGEFGALRAWLAEHVHQHGRKYTPAYLLNKVVGEHQLDPQPLIRYLTAKVDDLYGIEPLDEQTS